MRTFSLLLLLPACSFADGQGWASMTASIETKLEIDDAHQSDTSTLKTDQDFAITLESFELQTTGVAIYVTAAAGGERTAFDPANPPPGYSLCHGGHCHTADGAIETYEEIAAKVSGSTADALHRTLELSEQLDLVQPQEKRTDEVSLGLVEVSSVGLLVQRAQVRGTVSIEAVDQPFRIDLDLETPAILRPAAAPGLPVALGPSGPTSLNLQLSLQEHGTFFDGVRYSNLGETAGTILVNEQTNHAVWELFLAKLAVLPISVQRATE